VIYVKSLLAGVGALIAYYFLFVTVGMRLLLRMPPDLLEGAGYVSSSPWVPLWLILVIALLFSSRAIPPQRSQSHLFNLPAPLNSIPLPSREIATRPC
jgi:hypothetical protein